MTARRRSVAAALALVALLAAGQTQAALAAPARAAALGTTVTFKPSADAFVSRAAPSRNFGRDRVLRTDRSARSYIRFRVRGVTGPVGRAVLMLHLERRGGTFRAWSARSSNWGERSITYANAPSPGRRAGSARARSAGAWVAVDVSRLVHGNGTVTLVLTGSVQAASRQQGGRDAPRLAVQVGGRSNPTAAAAGNIACDPTDPDYNGGQGTPDACRQQSTSDLLVASPPDAVLLLGDAQYVCGGYQAYLQVFDPTWGRLKSIIHPTLSNHDRFLSGGTDCDPTAGASGYFRYFGAAAGDPAKAYYSFDLGAWHIISLNSNCQAFRCEQGSPQQRWLAADLAHHAGACSIAFFHNAAFTSGLGGDEHVEALWATLTAARVDVALVAHNHIYERFAPQNATGGADPRGVREFVVGTGGRSHGPFTAVKPNSQVRNNTSFGVLRLGLRPTSYSWRFEPVAGSSFTDSGSTTCH